MKSLPHLVVCVLLALVVAGVSLGTASADTPAPAPDTAAPTADTGWAAQVTAGYQHTCVLTVAGGVLCWGANDFGQLGDGTTRNRATPMAVVGLGEEIVQVSTGDMHTCALTTRGGVKCWGGNFDGELGDGTLTGRLTPIAVVGLTSGVQALSAGSSHTCALLAGGDVQCWGDNYWGQLGDGTTTPRMLPVTVDGLTAGAQALSAGGTHTCALLAGGDVQCWGDNAWGELGDGTAGGKRLTPVTVRGLRDRAQTVSLGRGHTCALTVSGGVQCWGYNGYGELGDDRLSGRHTPVPVDVVGLSAGVQALDAAGVHTCAVTARGGVQCWGDNLYGKLGDGTTKERWTPVAVSGLATGAHAVSAGMHHTCAQLADDSVQCWGWNQYGQLGDGTISERRTPVTVVLALPYDCTTVTEIPQPECSALVDLFRSTNGCFWHNRTSWLQSPTPCTWHGVTCEAGHVSQLNLPANNLVDALPVTLGNLTTMQHLDLSANQLTGPLPLVKPAGS